MEIFTELLILIGKVRKQPGRDNLVDDTLKAGTALLLCPAVYLKPST
jgi:hypothetical protein